MPTRRVFSVEEANALIPELEAIFQRLDALEAELGARANEIERMGYSASFRRDRDDPPEVAERRRIITARREEFQEQIDRFDELGAMLEDRDLGIVDLASEVDGAEIRLCWQRGEASIAHYHAPGAGFRRRCRLLSSGPI